MITCNQSPSTPVRNVSEPVGLRVVLTVGVLLPESEYGGKCDKRNHQTDLLLLRHTIHLLSRGKYMGEEEMLLIEHPPHWGPGPSL